MCPRRWALSRASYPEVWERPGYPPKPTLAALVGDVVHLALEQVSLALHARTVDKDTAGVAALRELGGYSSLIRRAINERLRKLERNPRMAPRLESIRSLLGQKVPEIRHRVQSVVTRVQLAAAGYPQSRGSGHYRGPIVSGTYPEVELRAMQLRLTGRADLVCVSDDEVTIMDYKTGQPDPSHIDQLRVYALLWKHDTELNPTGRAATKLVIVYTTHDEAYDAPSETELADLREALIRRMHLAEAELAVRPPPARPDPESCRHCTVKHMCEEYWSALPLNQDPSTDDGEMLFLDCEGVVSQRNGPRSFVLDVSRMGTEILLRTPTEAPPFTLGDRVRLMGVTYTEDDDAEQRVATITRGSEVFVIS